MFTVLAVPVSRGEITLLDKAGWGARLELEAAAAYVNTHNTNFGSGRVDRRSGDNTGDAQWFEAYFKPSLSLSFASERQGTLFATIAQIASLTEGDGDAAGFTNSGDDSVDREKLYFGWRSGRVFGGRLGRDALEISYGQQEFSLGSGFLIMDGNFDLFGEGTYWLTPRKAFKRAALLKTHPTRCASISSTSTRTPIKT